MFQSGLLGWGVWGWGARGGSGDRKGRGRADPVVGFGIKGPILDCPSLPLPQGLHCPGPAPPL